MWGFKRKPTVLGKPTLRFRDGKLILATLPPGRTAAQIAVWRQELTCLAIKYNGNPFSALGRLG